MKRTAATAGASGREPPAQRRKVKHETYQKWVSQYDRNRQTMVWLDCDTAIERGVKLVTKLNSVRFVPNTRIIFRNGKILVASGLPGQTQCERPTCLIM